MAEAGQRSLVAVRADGVRELAMIEWAVGASQASFTGKSPYADLTEMAAAHLY